MRPGDRWPLDAIIIITISWLPNTGRPRTRAGGCTAMAFRPCRRKCWPLDSIHTNGKRRDSHGGALEWPNLTPLTLLIMDTTVHRTSRPRCHGGSMAAHGVGKKQAWRSTDSSQGKHVLFSSLIVLRGNQKRDDRGSCWKQDFVAGAQHRQNRCDVIKEKLDSRWRRT